MVEPKKTTTARLGRIRRTDVFVRVISTQSNILLLEVKAYAEKQKWDWVLLWSGLNDNTYYVGLHEKRKGVRTDVSSLGFLKKKFKSATDVYDTSPQIGCMTSRRAFAAAAFPNGVDERNILGRSNGDYFSPASLNKYLRKISDILDPDIKLSDLLHQDVVKVKEVLNVDKARQIVSMEENEQTARPDMTEPITIHYKQRTVLGDVIPNGIQKSVTLTPLPGDINTKQKHIYVYSDGPNFGKTRTTEEAFAPYNVGNLQDCKNAKNVEKDVQILWIDEYGRTDRKHLEFNQLKAICGSGGTQHGYINIKGSGRSYIPRADVQLYITSNKHPFHVYSQWSAERHCYIISKSDADTLRARFKIICIDGDEEADALKYIDTEEMTNEQYQQHIRIRFYKMLDPIIKTGHVQVGDVAKAITEMWNAHCKKYLDSIVNTDHFRLFFEPAIEKDDQRAVMDIFQQYKRPNGFVEMSHVNPTLPVTLKGRQQGQIDQFFLPQ